MPRPSDAKDRLLKAAHQLIWENSYASVSVDHICERAGAKKGTFYHFFESKEALALATIEVGLQEFLRMMNDAFSPLVPPLERFERMHEFAMVEQRLMTAEIGRVAGCPMLSLGSEMGSRGPLSARIQEILAAELQYYESAIRDAIAAKLIPDADPKLLASQVQLLVIGALIFARITNSMEPLDNIPANIRRTLRVS
jgi:TetR/AcrR family transcriptional regulator, transcriptional repressor for nem operon